MREEVSTARVIAVNGMDPAEREAMEAAGVQLGPVGHVRAVVNGRWVDTSSLDAIPSEQDLDALDAVASQGWADPDDRETDVLLERAAYDLGPADDEPW